MAIKTDKSGFVKQDDGLVLNNNLHELEHYRTRVKALQNNEDETKKTRKLENRISALESKLDLILEKLSRDS
jgi:hypothetical protein